jgi:hypothetical protein
MSLWEATETEWYEMPLSQPLWFPSLLATLLEGNMVHEDLGSFVILSLLSGILIHIATYERYRWYKPPASDEAWTTSMLKTLQAWGDTWKRHPHAKPNPYNSPHGPLMVDCLPILNIAFFHVYVPDLLDRIKKNLASGQWSTREEFHALLTPKSDAERNLLFRPRHTRPIHFR